jgi:hypothetical protein
MATDATQEAIVAAVIANGWRQGCTLPAEAHGEVEACIERDLSAEHACIVITHSCDLVRPDPLLDVEIVVASPTGKDLDGSVAHGRSRKRIELLVAVKNSPRVYEIKAKDRFEIPLSLLATNAPDPSRHLADVTQRSLIEWLVARYARPGLPDAFETRIHDQRKHLGKAAQKLGNVWRIYIGLSPWDDLPAQELYDVELRFVMYAEDYEVIAKRAETLNSIEDFLKVLGKCQGLKVPTDPQEVLCADDDLTLFEERHLRRWERFDYASFADPEHVQDEGQV